MLEEAMDSYKHDIVFELSSNDPDEMENNTERIVEWVDNWKKNKQPVPCLFSFIARKSSERVLKS